MPNFVHTKTDPDRLKVAASNISESIAMLRRAFSTIESLLFSSDDSLSKKWEGPASDQFFAQYVEDQLLFNNMLDILEGVNDRLREAAGIFENADSRALELVEQLKNK